MPLGQQLAERLTLELAEIGLAVLGEDRRDRPPLARLDPLVDVLDAPAEPRPRARATVVLPAPMNPTR